MIYFSIVLNRLRILLSDKLFILAMLVVPVTLSLITGYALKKEKLGYIPIVLVDEDKTDSSALLVDRLKKKEGIKADMSNRDKALKELSKDNIEAMIIIEKGFQDKLRRGETEELITLMRSPSTYSAELLKEMVAVETLRLYTDDFTYEWIKKSLEDNGGDAFELTREEVSERIESYWHPKPIMDITYEEVEAIPKSDETVSIPSFAAASLGLLVLFIMLGLLFGSGWICEEKANGTFQRVLSIKNAALPLFTGNLSAMVLMGLFQAVVFVLVQRFLFQIQLISGLLSWLVVLLYILCAASLSMLMAALFETPHQLQAAAPVFALITGLMGGCLWNLLGVPKSLLTMALLTPQGWTLRALTGLYAAPDSFSIALPAILTLFGLSMVMLALAYWRLLRAVRTNQS